GLAGVAAVGVAASAVLGETTNQARRDLDAAMAVLTAPDVQAVSQPITGGGTGSLVVSRGRGRLVFTASGLPSPPSSRSYELWLMGPAGVRPAGLLRSGVPTLASPESGDDRVGLTVEPAGGSQQPTTQPIMLADLPAA
ncbi:MAG: anti-sigma factor, partial [Nonomuraea sp.]|nr:anti-sigma factor [Nonomuraea sp.]